MTEPSEHKAAIFAADRLQGSVNGLKEEMAGLRSYGKRSRKIIWGLVASLILDVILSLVVVAVGIQVHEANTLAEANRNTQIATCESTNQSRQVAVNLWGYVLEAAAKNPENQTPERKKQVADFRAYMESAYAPRDCSQNGR